MGEDDQHSDQTNEGHQHGRAQSGVDVWDETPGGDKWRHEEEGLCYCGCIKQITLYRRMVTVRSQSSLRSRNREGIKYFNELMFLSVKTLSSSFTNRLNGVKPLTPRDSQHSTAAFHFINLQNNQV